MSSRYLMYFFIMFKASMFPALAASIIYCHLTTKATNYASLSSTQHSAVRAKVVGDVVLMGDG